MSEDFIIPCLRCGKPRGWRPHIEQRNKFFFCNKACYDKWIVTPEAQALIQALAKLGRQRAMEQKVEHSYQMSMKVRVI